MTCHWSLIHDGIDMAHRYIKNHPGDFTGFSEPSTNSQALFKALKKMGASEHPAAPAAAPAPAPTRGKCVPGKRSDWCSGPEGDAGHKQEKQVAAAINRGDIASALAEALELAKLWS